MRLKPGQPYKIVSLSKPKEPDSYGVYIRPVYRKLGKKYTMKEFKLFNGEIVSFNNDFYKYIPMTDEDIENAKVESL